jgi:hypothetical protein
MKKNKIQIGQCYSYHDIVYMVMGRYCSDDSVWIIQDTLNKGTHTISEKELLTWHRPFQNWG